MSRSYKKPIDTLGRDKKFAKKQANKKVRVSDDVGNYKACYNSRDIVEYRYDYRYRHLDDVSEKDAKAIKAIASRK